MLQASEGTAFAGTLISLAPQSSGREHFLISHDGVVTVVAERMPDAYWGLRTLDFGNRVIVPGFVDPHAHVEVAALARATMVDCRAPAHATVSDVLDELATAERGLAPLAWLVGQANLFFDQKLRDRRLPTRQELDAISRKRPIALRAGGHRTVLNTHALEMTGVASYLGRQGGMGGAVVELDAAGEPSGVIAELDHVLQIPGPRPENLRPFIRDGITDLFLAHGVTTIGEISQTTDGLSCLAALDQAGELQARVVTYLWAPGTMTFGEALKHGRQWQSAASPDADFAVRGIKLFADGGYSSLNAATRTPYASPPALHRGSRGKLNLSQRQLESAIRRAREAGLQLAIHTNGERAQDAVCAAVTSAGGSGNLPTRLEHAGNVMTGPVTTAAWQAAGAIPVSQPVFLYNFGDFLPVYLDQSITPGLFPFRQLLADGWDICGSSDVHLGAEPEQTNPLFGIWCCVARRSFLDAPTNAGQAVPVEEALRMHTINAAAALGEADTRGSLAPGKVTDLVVLERDPRTIPADGLRSLNVDYVFRGGRLAYARDGAAPWTEQDVPAPATTSERLAR